MRHEVNRPPFAERPHDGHHGRAVDRVRQQFQHGLSATNFLCGGDQRSLVGLGLLDVHGHAHGQDGGAAGVSLHHASACVHPAPLPVKPFDLVLGIDGGGLGIGQQGPHLLPGFSHLVGVNPVKQRLQPQRLGGAHPARTHQSLELVAVGDAVVRDVVFPKTELCGIGRHAVTLLGQDHLVAL